MIDVIDLFINLSLINLFIKDVIVLKPFSILRIILYLSYIDYIEF